MKGSDRSAGEASHRSDRSLGDAPQPHEYLRLWIEAPLTELPCTDCTAQPSARREHYVRMIDGEPLCQSCFHDRKEQLASAAGPGAEQLSAGVGTAFSGP